MSDATRRLADELTDDELDTLVEMVQARNEGRLTRREVVKSGGLLAALGLGGGAAVGSASADASTSDSDGNIGEPGNRVDAFLDGANANSLITGKQNNSQVNLTRLVENGTYTDILDALVNEPSNQPNGISYQIEPGAYQVSTQRTLLESNFVVEAKGTGQTWNSSAATMPVVIEWAGTTGGGERMLTLGDGSTKVEGVTFRNIEFRPDTANDDVTLIHQAGTSSGVTRDVTFDRCAFRVAGQPISSADKQQNFDYKYIDCGWQVNSSKANLGSQTQIRGGYLLVQSGGVGIDVGQKSSVVGLSSDVANGSTGLKAGGQCYLEPSNIEGDQSTNCVGVEIEHTSSDATYLSGALTGHDYGAVVTNGSIIYCASPAGNSSFDLDMRGSSNDHNGSVILGLGATDIQYSNRSQQVTHISGFPGYSNLSASDVPPGALLFDYNRGGSGNTALLIGPTNQNSATNYIDIDGTL